MSYNIEALFNYDENALTADEYEKSEQKYLSEQAIEPKKTKVIKPIIKKAIKSKCENILDDSGELLTSEEILLATNGTKDLYQMIKSGINGDNIGISSNSKKLDSVIFGLQRGFMYTVGADTGGGKTSFVLDCFVYNLLRNAKEQGLDQEKINIIYYSFEMSEPVLLAKLMSRYILDEFNKVLTFEMILSLGKVLSLQDQRDIHSAFEWINSISKRLTIYDTSLSPAKINATLKAWVSNYGEIKRTNNGNKSKFIPKDPKQYIIAVMDHVGLIHSDGNLKTSIDAVVSIFMEYRNVCRLTSVLVQQMNRNAKSMSRKLNGFARLQLDDFKDTSSTVEGSEVVLGLFYPNREKIALANGYPVKTIMKDNLRILQVIKNRYGPSDKEIGLNFYGEANFFRDMPKAEEITSYDEFTDIQKYIEKTRNAQATTEINETETRETETETHTQTQIIKL